MCDMGIGFCIYWVLEQFRLNPKEIARSSKNISFSHLSIILLKLEHTRECNI
jgi:hypothetical protein